MKKVRKLLALAMALVLLAGFAPALAEQEANYTGVSVVSLNNSTSHQTFAGTLTSASSVLEYQITIDYSSNPTPALAFMRNTGGTVPLLEVIDPNGTIVFARSVGHDSGGSNYALRGHHRFVRPANAPMVRTYTLRVRTTQFVNSTNFQINVGTANNLENMLFGIHNATTINRNHIVSGGSLLGNLIQDTIPSRNRSEPGQGVFYRFTNDNNTVITLSNNINGALRFRIYDAQAVESARITGLSPVPRADTYFISTATRTEHRGSSSHVQKARARAATNGSTAPSLDLPPGVYYIEVYSTFAGGPAGFVSTNFYVLAVGHPIMGLTSNERFNANSSVTSNVGVWSSWSTVDVPTTVPYTAFVRTVEVRTGLSFANVRDSRVRIGTRTFSAGIIRRFIIEFSPTMTNNVPVSSGNWNAGFMSNSGTQSAFPHLWVTYFFEIGD